MDNKNDLNILQQILEELKKVNTKVDNLETELKEVRQDIKNLDAKFDKNTKDIIYTFNQTLEQTNKNTETLNKISDAFKQSV